MHPPAIPQNEQARLAALEALDVLDSPPDAELDALTALAAEVCRVPISLVSLVDHKRQWFKSNNGMPVAEVAREISFCGHAILEHDVLEIPDAREDPRFSDNPLVTGAPFIRYYAGAPLKTKGDLHIGTLCVIDAVPHALSPVQKRCLKVLASSAVNVLELRRLTAKLGAAVLAEQRANTERSWTSAYVAHEIRNQMTVLLGALDLISLAQLPRREQHALEAARGSADAMHRIVLDALDLARASAGHLSFTPQEFDLRQCLTDLADQYRALMNDGPVTLELVVSAALPTRVIGDPHRLGQVLHNLLGNALKFTRRGTVSLSAEPEGAPTDGAFVLLLRVRDTAGGIDEAILRELFQPFRTSGNHQGGTGLGLYIAKQLVELMGGTISADTEPGAGTTFTVRVPLRRAA